MRVLITGSNGQLGSAFRSLGNQEGVDLIFMDRKSLDITSELLWNAVLEEHQPNFVINAAAYTAVDNAESDRESAYALNERAVHIASRVTKEKNVRLLQISTDYVFNGESNTPYKEEDPTNPKSVYGASKRAGELEVLNFPEHLVVRVAWLYSPFGKNFMKTMRTLFQTKEQVNVVDDQIGSPTCAMTFASDLLEFLMKSPEGGIYHYSQGGEGSWFDFAHHIHAQMSATCKLERVKTGFFQTAATRPAYSKLDATKFEEVLGRTIPTWQSCYRDCTKELNEK